VSSQHALSRLSNRLLQEDGGRRITEKVLDRDYGITVLLNGLSKSQLGDFLAFKGGTAIKKCYFLNYRFSQDLDFTLRSNEWTVHSLEDLFFSLFSDLADETGLGFSLETPLSSARNTLNSRIHYAGLTPSVQPEAIKLDITIRERIVFETPNRPILGYPEYQVTGDESGIAVYSLFEILTEKAVAILDAVRSEPRDLYDLAQLWDDSGMEADELAQSVEEKIQFRISDLGHDVSRYSGKLNFVGKEAAYQQSWESRLSHQMSNLAEFKGVYRTVRKVLRQAGLLDRGWTG
jgi:predicted nucleotidyltransferase component of viral defense system